MAKTQIKEKVKNHLAAMINESNYIHLLLHKKVSGDVEILRYQ